MLNIATEAFVVGLVMMIIFMIIHKYDKNTTRSAFLTGVLGHLMFEYAGANKWYCKHGAACK